MQQPADAPIGLFLLLLTWGRGPPCRSGATSSGRALWRWCWWGGVSLSDRGIPTVFVWILSLHRQRHEQAEAEGNQGVEMAHAGGKQHAYQHQRGDARNLEVAAQALHRSPPPGKQRPHTRSAAAETGRWAPSGGCTNPDRAKSCRRSRLPKSPGTACPTAPRSSLPAGSGY